MTAETLSGAAGILLSLCASYIPKFNEWFASLDGTKKRLLMLAALVVVAGAAFGLSCAGWAAGWGIDQTCDQPGLQKLLKLFVMALIANQGVFLITPKTEAVYRARGK